MIECFYESLEGMKSKFAEMEKGGTAMEAATLVMESHYPAEERPFDPIKVALKEAGAVLPLDPLAEVMHSKVEASKKLTEANYAAWQSNFLVMQSELISLVEEFNSNDDYKRAGYRMKASVYDILPFEKYLDITLEKRVSRTWFIGVDIFSTNSRERILFFFGRLSKGKWQIKNPIPVSLITSRFDGTSYRILQSEPISLRETVYADGQLVFLFSDGKVVTGNVPMVLRTMLAEIIKCYL